ncbi:alpha/beta hydrolase [Nevskia soli]|uniref:alpha/beta hydrolase n=1 Tax=Nevskia soli TaxID=418856 RepID=UPI001C5CBD73|nr:alpha/beta hydrolase [Nevskia soli]
MKTLFVPLIFAVLSMVAIAGAQDVVPLYPGVPPGSKQENYPEKQYFSKVWNEEIIANVTRPTITIFKPSPKLSNGTAMVIVPGGGLMAISVATEGASVAKYLAAKGITAILLKYRIAHTGDDAAQEFAELSADKPKYDAMLATVAPLAVADTLTAMGYARQHASEWGISPDRVGIIGFSAGGFLAAEVAVHYTPETRPAFVSVIYGGLQQDAPVPADAPPMFLAAASDDELGLTPGSIALYPKWTAANKLAELHLYVKGGHGFGMKQQNLPTDHWIDRFTDWLQLEGFLKK